MQSLAPILTSLMLYFFGPPAPMVSVMGALLLLSRSKERQLGGEVQPSLLHFDVVGDRLLCKLRQRRRRRIVIQAEIVSAWP